MKYRIEMTRAAEREFAKLVKKNKAAALAVKKVILALSDDPRHSGVEKLTDTDLTFYRVRAGDFRVIYEIHDHSVVVLVVKVADRKEVYRYLKT